MQINMLERRSDELPNCSPSTAKTTVEPGRRWASSLQEVVDDGSVQRRDAVRRASGSREDLEQAPLGFGQVVAESDLRSATGRARSGDRRAPCTRCRPRRASVTRLCSHTPSASHIPRTWVENTVVDVVGEGPDLADAVAVGDHRQDRLKESAAQDLDLASSDQARSRSINSGWRSTSHSSSGPEVCRATGARCAISKNVEKRAIVRLDRLLEHRFELAERLMVMESEDQAELGMVDPSTSVDPSI